MKMISQVEAIMKRLASPNEFQIALQSLGHSLNVAWENEEIVVNTDDHITIFVFSCGEPEADREMCSDLLSANPTVRVVLVVPKSYQPPSDPVVGVPARFCSFVEFPHSRDTAQFCLVLSAADSLEPRGLAEVELKMLQGWGWKALAGLPTEQEALIRSQFLAADVKKHEVGPGSTVTEAKGILPIVREQSPYRALLADIALRGGQVIVYMETNQSDVEMQVDRLRSLSAIGLIRAQAESGRRD